MTDVTHCLTDKLPGSATHQSGWIRCRIWKQFPDKLDKNNEISRYVAVSADPFFPNLNNGKAKSDEPR